MLSLLYLAFAIISVANARPSAADTFSGPELAQPEVLGRSLNEQGGFSFPAFRRNVASQKRSAAASTNNNWWITVGIGSPPQDLNVLPDSGANDFTVQSTLLPAANRGNEFLYDPSKSSTAKQMQGYTYREAYGSGYFDSGVVYQDTVTFGSSTFSNIPILVMNNNSGPSYNDRTGNLGIDPDTGGQSTSPKKVPTFMQSIRSSISKGVIAFNYNVYTWTGEMDVGYIDSSKYTGSLVYVPNAAGSTEWVIQVDGMVVNNTLQKIPFSALIDTGTGASTVPRAALDAYFSQVPAASYNSGFGTYLFPCDTYLPDMTFSIGGLGVRIPKASWIGTPIGSSNTCGCSFLPGNGFFGDSWIEGAFLVFDYDNVQVGLANKPTDSTTIPPGVQAGTTYFCTGTGFTGTCKNLGWNTDSCNTLQNTPYYHNIGAYGPDHGGCTLYSDTGCTQPLSDSQNIHNPGTTNAGTSGKSAGSYACFYPNDYPPMGSGTFYLCNDVNYRGNCSNLAWNSYACQTLPPTLANNVSSAGPNHGYCLTYTDTGCVNAVQGSAPFAYPGKTRTGFGKQMQSFMCV